MGGFLDAIIDFIQEHGRIYVSVSFCLSGDSLVTVLGKERIYKKPVSEVSRDEYLLTYKGKDLVYSRVIANIRDEGPKAFLTFKIKDIKSNIKSISTTENHPMIMAGGIITQRQAQIAINSGADVIVSHVFQMNLVSMMILQLLKIMIIII